MLLQPGQTKNDQYSGKICGIKFALFALAASSNTAFSGQLFDLTQINVKVTLTRGNNKYVIFNGGLSFIHALTNWYNNTYRYVYGSNYIQLTAASSGVFANGIIPLTFNFPTIEVGASDSFVVEVVFNAASLTSQLDPNNFTLEVDKIPSTGYEHYIPIINYFTIAPGESKLNHGCGNAVEKVLFLNVDMTSKLLTSQVMQNVAVSSDKLSYNDDYNMLITDRYHQVYAGADNSTYGTYVDLWNQSFMLIDCNVPLFGVNVNGNLNYANVNSGKNFLITQNVVVDPNKLLMMPAEKKADNINLLAALGINVKN